MTTSQIASDDEDCTVVAINIYKLKETIPQIRIKLYSEGFQKVLKCCTWHYFWSRQLNKVSSGDHNMDCAFHQHLASIDNPNTL